MSVLQFTSLAMLNAHPDKSIHMDESVWPTIQRWLDRGDGAAIYQNVDLSSRDTGRCQCVSYGSAAAMIEQSLGELPHRMPDIGADINWRYMLVAVVVPDRKSNDG